ncbi:MAG: PGPGW domain-containing protein [Planctomycetaceae bacterium]
MKTRTSPLSRRNHIDDRSSRSFDEIETCAAEAAAIEEGGLARCLFVRYGARAVRKARQLAILIVGVSVLLIGVAGIVLPAVPAIVLLPAGLAILSIEFVWARKLMVRLQDHLKKARDRCRNRGRA